MKRTAKEKGKGRKEKKRLGFSIIFSISQVQTKLFPFFELRALFPPTVRIILMISFFRH